MGKPAAKLGDRIVAVDTHLTIVPAGPATAVVPLPYPFNGTIDNSLSANVKVNGRPAATLGSTATNTPPHIAMGIGFQRPPSNMGRIIQGSTTVLINGKPAARAGDTAMTCNDPVDLPVGKVVAMGTVMIGG